MLLPVKSRIETHSSFNLLALQTALVDPELEKKLTMHHSLYLKIVLMILSSVYVVLVVENLQLMEVMMFLDSLLLEEVLGPASLVSLIACLHI